MPVKGPPAVPEGMPGESPRVSPRRPPPDLVLQACEETIGELAASVSIVPPGAAAASSVAAEPSAAEQDPGKASRIKCDPPSLES